ncbi:MAG: hypothetical protein JJE22_16975 [Bacteroidia bacterium]|nr:hypothetical protein [Bacteroidia bacterium]
MKNRGRPVTSQLQLKNGYYIEVCNKGMKRGMKIRSESQQAMEDTARLYAYKEVIILGEYKNGIPFTEIPASK